MPEQTERPQNNPQNETSSFKDKLYRNLKKPVLVAAATVATAGAAYGVFKAADGGSAAKDVIDGNVVKVERTAEGGQPSQTAVVVSPTETSIKEPEIALSEQAVKVKESLEKGFATLNIRQTKVSNPRYLDLQVLLGDLKDCDSALTNTPTGAGGAYYGQVLAKCEEIGAATKAINDNGNVLNGDVLTANSWAESIHWNVYREAAKVDPIKYDEDYWKRQLETIYNNGIPGV